jgi:hypothetical protein
MIAPVAERVRLRHVGERTQGGRNVVGRDAVGGRKRERPNERPGRCPLARERNGLSTCVASVCSLRPIPTQCWCGRHEVRLQASCLLPLSAPAEGSHRRREEQSSLGSAHGCRLSSEGQRPDLPADSQPPLARAARAATRPSSPVAERLARRDVGDQTRIANTSCVTPSLSYVKSPECRLDIRMDDTPAARQRAVVSDDVRDGSANSLVAERVNKDVRRPQDHD